MFESTTKILDVFISEVLTVLRGLFLCEDEHFVNHHSDYFRLFEISVGILEHYKYDDNTLRFSPTLISNF